jgi:hypothetical protein
VTVPTIPLEALDDLLRIGEVLSVTKLIFSEGSGVPVAILNPMVAISKQLANVKM